MAKSVNDSRIMEQKDTISQLNMVISSQNELIMSLRSTVEECNATISSLRGQVEYLTRKLFGTSSEKSKTVAGQLNLFDEAEQEAQLPEEEAATEAVIKEHTRSARRTNKETFKGVPSRDEVIPLSGDQRRCADFGSEMEVIGKEFVRQEFRFTPAKGEVVNIYRETAKCPRCSTLSAMARNIQFVKANVPEALIPHSYASASAAAWVMYQKYANSSLQKEKAVLDAFWAWVSSQAPKKGTRFKKAVNYAQNHKEQFLTYLEDGRCSLSNNLSENSIRPFTAGRKNWLFSDTPKGAEASATIYTLVEMARAHGLNIYKYLKYLLERLPGTKMADSALEKLVPWNQDVKANCSGAM